MRGVSQSIATWVLVACLPLVSFAEAPVVDDSENYAMLDIEPKAQAPANVNPGADEAQVSAPLGSAEDENEQPLAKDDGSAGALADNAELIDKLQALKQDVQELRGQVEVLTHDLKKLQEQQLTFYKDLDARIRGEKSTAAVAPAPSSTPSISGLPSASALGSGSLTDELKGVQQSQANQPKTLHLNPADEQVAYLAAYELVKGKRYNEALQAMQAFTEQYPDGGYAANAQYWLGELYMVKQDYPKAIAHFDIVLKQFPKSSKAAPSTLKIGYALAASGKEHEARKRLQDVISHYPDTPTAHLAKTKLRLMNAR